MNVDYDSWSFPGKGSSRTSLSSCENIAGLGPVPKKKSILKKDALNREETETLLSNDSGSHRFPENGEDSQSTTPLIDDSYTISPCSTPERHPFKARPNLKTQTPSRALPEPGKIAPKAKFPSLGSDASDSAEHTDDSDDNPSTSPKDMDNQTGRDPLGVSNDPVKMLSGGVRNVAEPMDYDRAIHLQTFADSTSDSAALLSDTPSCDNHKDKAQTEAESKAFSPTRDKDGNTIGLVINNVGIARSLDEPIAFIDDP